MPIPFRNNEQIETLGHAAFLHLEAVENALRGCLFFINALGEPQEFIYNRIELISDVLWRPGDRAMAAQRRLMTTLFSASKLSPRFLLVRASQIAPALFGENGQLHLEIPVGRVIMDGEKVLSDATEVVAEIATLRADGAADTVEIFWTPAPPVEVLFAHLAERGLLLEPFNRCAAGLDEVYNTPPQS